MTVAVLFVIGSDYPLHDCRGSVVEKTNRTATVMERILYDAGMPNENHNSYFDSVGGSSLLGNLSTYP